MSKPQDSLWVVVAAYNEAAVIRSVVARLRELYHHVLVVDDGSEDATLTKARSAGATVVKHPVNLGQGAALQTGIDAALSLGATYIVTFDADDQHVPEDVGRLVDALRRTGADVALGNRFAGSAPNMPRIRRIVLRIASKLTGLTTGLWVSDPHNGLRAFTADAARKLDIRQNRMAHASEIIAEIARIGLNYVEVPVKIRYTDYSMDKGQDTLDAVTVILDLITGRLNR